MKPEGLATLRDAPASGARLRILIALSGLHRVQRGAEVVFQSLARVIAARAGYTVTLIGGVEPDPSTNYRFIHAGHVPRERFERWPRSFT